MNDDEFWHLWLSVLLYGGCFFMMLISYFLTNYVRRYQRHVLVKILQDSPGSDAGYIKELEYLVSAWRDRWFLTIGVDLILQNKKINIGALSEFEISEMPARFRYLAMCNAICIFGGFIWMIIAASWAKWGGFI